MRFVVLHLPSSGFFATQESAEQHALKLAHNTSMGLLYVLEVKTVVGPLMVGVKEPAAQRVSWLHRLWRWGKP